MRAVQVREMALVVGVATAGVLVAALVTMGPLALGDTPDYPRVVELHPPPEPQP